MSSPIFGTVCSDYLRKEKDGNIRGLLEPCAINVRAMSHARL